MATPRRAVRVNVSEGNLEIELYKKMLKMVEEVYNTALGLSNSQELASVLDEAGKLKVKLNERVSRLREEEEIRKATEELFNREGDSDG